MQRNTVLKQIRKCKLHAIIIISWNSYMVKPFTYFDSLKKKCCSHCWHLPSSFYPGTLCLWYLYTAPTPELPSWLLLWPHCTSYSIGTVAYLLESVHFLTPPVKHLLTRKALLHLSHSISLNDLVITPILTLCYIHEIVDLLVRSVSSNLN